MEAVKSAAENGDDDHQLNCYGLGTLFFLNCVFILTVRFFTVSKDNTYLFFSVFLTIVTRITDHTVWNALPLSGNGKVV